MATSNIGHTMKRALVPVLAATLSVLLVTHSVAEETRGLSRQSKAAPVQSTNLGKYHAVLIGVDNYVSINKLKTPVKDVEALAEVLKTQYGFDDITLLTDKTADKPTASNIFRLMKEKASKLTENDNLLIYYAGHGEVDSITEEGYWIPIEGKRDDTTSWIPHSQIRALLETKNVKVKNFILVVDSCYSGKMLSRSIPTTFSGEKESYALNQKLFEKAAKKSREVITSGGTEPVADAVAGSDHSLFAHYLLQALKDNQRKYIDMGTLFDEQIRPKVNKMGRQSPERSRVRSAIDEEGVFVLSKIGLKESPLPVDPNSEIEVLNRKIAALTDLNKTLLAKGADSAKNAAEAKAAEARANIALKQKMELEKKLKDGNGVKLQQGEDIKSADRVKSSTPSVPSDGRFVVIGDVVFDKKTNLMWLQNANITNSGKEYDDSESYVSGLSYAGYNDWHIPTKNDWRSLLPENMKGIDNALPEHPFNNVFKAGQYWVATSFIDTLGINLGNGSTTRLNKKKIGYLWPVRYSSPDEIAKLKSASSKK